MRSTVFERIVELSYLRDHPALRPPKLSQTRETTIAHWNTCLQYKQIEAMFHNFYFDMIHPFTVGLTFYGRSTSVPQITGDGRHLAFASWVFLPGCHWPRPTDTCRSIYTWLMLSDIRSWASNNHARHAWHAVIGLHAVSLNGENSWISLQAEAGNVIAGFARLVLYLYNIASKRRLRDMVWPSSECASIYLIFLEPDK